MKFEDYEREHYARYAEAMETINKRFNRIMDKYLLPAGYEFQRVQHDYERLQQGKELFDQDILGAIQTATDNNERVELLTSLKDQVLPNYDDLPAVYRDLIDPLISVVSHARATAPQPIKTTFGELEGKTAADVAEVVVEIFELLRYVDIDRTFHALLQIFRDEPDERVSKAILDAVLHLAEYDLQVWEQAGAAVQSILLDAVERLSAEDQDAVRPLIIALWESALKSDINGTTWKADAVTLSSAALPVSPAVKAIRDKAVTGLFNLFKRTTSDDQRREVISALREATRPAPRAQYSNGLLALTIVDGRRIVEFFAGEAASLSYELRESMEYNYLFDYHRAREIAESDNDRFGCRDVAKALMESIKTFRDRINGDQTYTRYKTLVGFETVLPEHWDDEDRDYRKVEEFRTAESGRFVRDISRDNEDEWFRFIERCASTKSDDGATFPIFRKFLTNLARTKPETAKRMLARASADLLSFLPSLLNGPFQGDMRIWQDFVDKYLADGAHLTSIVLHWRELKPPWPDIVKWVLERAIADGDDVAVIQCVLLAIEAGPGESVPPNDQFFKPAISYLTSRKDARWARGAWFADSALPFFDAMTQDEAELLLDNLVEVPRIEYQVERMLAQIARRQLSLVYGYFGKRLGRRTDRRSKSRYEALPYRFHGLERELSRDPKLAVATVRRWYGEEKKLFRFNGGRLLSAAFPRFQPELSDEVCALVSTGTDADADFVLAVMENYHGEPATHEVFKRIIAKYPGDRAKMSVVRSSFDSTGVVTGEFGFAEAMRGKKALIEPWLADPRPAVQAFAREHIHSLDLRIADEQRRAEQEKTLRDL